MQLASPRFFLCGFGGIILAFCAQIALLAQNKVAAPSTRRPAASVPFVGCKSDGQTGPADAPTGTNKSVSIDRDAAKELAYYESAVGFGVLAPRGWHCLGNYGSGGASLFASPEPIYSPDWRSGPAVELAGWNGGTSGRFEVAQIIARVFPAHKPFADAVIADFPGLLPSRFPYGPYPADKLTYKSKTVVEYRTPAQADGLGTHSSLKKNASPIVGAALLTGPTPDLLLLSVRLPPDLSRLAASIVRQGELDAASSAQK